MDNSVSIQCTTQGHNISKYNTPRGVVLDFSIDTNAPNPNASCKMSSGNLHGNFVLFDPSKDPGRCSDNETCQWLLNPDGIYIFTIDHITLVYKGS